MLLKCLYRKIPNLNIISTCIKKNESLIGRLRTTTPTFIRCNTIGNNSKTRNMLLYENSPMRYNFKYHGIFWEPAHHISIIISQHFHAPHTKYPNRELEFWLHHNYLNGFENIFRYSKDHVKENQNYVVITNAWELITSTRLTLLKKCSNLQTQIPDEIEIVPYQILRLKHAKAYFYCSRNVHFPELRTAFELLDRNQDGKVTTREFKIMLNNLGIDLREDKVEELIRCASHAGKELLDENDFLKFVKQIQELCPVRSPNEDDELDLLAAFKVFDMDNDGFITKDELRIAMEMIGEDVSEEQLTHIMEVADTDKDGKINYEEFSQLLS